MSGSWERHFWKSCCWGCLEMIGSSVGVGLRWRNFEVLSRLRWICCCFGCWVHGHRCLGLSGRRYIYHRQSRVQRGLEFGLELLDFWVRESFIPRRSVQMGYHQEVIQKARRDFEPHRLFRQGWGFEMANRAPWCYFHKFTRTFHQVSYQVPTLCQMMHPSRAPVLLWASP